MGIDAVNSEAYLAMVNCKSGVTAARPTNCCIPFTRLRAAGHLHLYRKLWAVRGEPGAAGTSERKPQSRSKMHS